MKVAGAEPQLTEKNNKLGGYNMDLVEYFLYAAILAVFFIYALIEFSEFSETTEENKKEDACNHPPRK